ncbi:hypothetical protein BD289DRAFT_486238 [Coniella lustricola]|uniref:Uncharacterized protein n=1 Tax=Coniella lustricola TaxID=2025994 RepID=A0A2T2ZVS6_9PEZI|nr:hypothetical protein BD289DRAFT_486238 [Coniella lustricola]
MARCGFCLFALRADVPTLPEDLDKAQDWTAERYEDKAKETSAGMSQMTLPTFLYKPPRNFIARSVARGRGTCLQTMNCVEKYSPQLAGVNIWETAAWTGSLVAVQGAYLQLSGPIPELKEYYSLFPDGDFSTVDEAAMRQ